MAVSGVTTWAMTARDMVTAAMREAGIVGSDETPEGSELAGGILRLNSMLKSWQMQGVNLWREQDTSITVTADTASVTLSAGIRQVFSARHIDSDAGYERLLGQWEREEYLSLPKKDTEGNPTIFYCSRERDALKLYFWPVPTTDQTVKIDCERIVNTVTDGGEDVDVPQHAYEAVWMGLAARLLPMFNASGATVDPLQAQRIERRAAELYQALLDDDRPQSVFIGPC